MNVMALPPGLTRWSWPSLPRERWRNGQGWTRPVAQALAPKDGALLWRVSLAEITQASEFSDFAGLDRTTVLVKGGPVTLQGPQARWTLAQPGDAAGYPGELPVQQGEPAQPSVFWNVMVARGQARARVRVCHEAMALPPRGTHLVWVLQGGFELLGPRWGAGVLMGPDEGLSSQLHESGWSLRPTEPGAACLLTQIEPLA
jgi:environmental stress-induced protein Ves